MRNLLFAFILTVSSNLATAASSGGLGFNFGVGLPFVQQLGLNYKMSDKFSFSAASNTLKFDVGVASVDLSMPEVLLHYHPFSGSFYIALGVGKESLDVSATSGSDTVSAKADATTAIVKLGWMWGLADGGFWFGMDMSMVSPSGADITINAGAVPTSSDAYKDAESAAKKFGETAYTNITFARFGYLF